MFYCGEVFCICLVSVSTPDGASQLLEDIDSKIQQHGSSSLVQGTPIFGPRTLQRTRDQARLLCCRVAVAICHTDAGYRKPLDIQF